jgi:hypothetical protein
MDHYSFIGAPPPEPEKEGGALPGVPAAEFDQADSAACPGTPPDRLASEPEVALGEGEREPLLPATSQAAVEEPASDLDAGLQAIVQKAQYVTNANGAALALRQGADVVCRAASGSTAPDRGARLQIKTGLTAECLRSGELLRCDNAMLDSRVDLESCKRLGIESIIITPIHQGKKLVGVLELFSAHAYSFQERDVEAVKGVAQEIGNLLAGGQVPEFEAPTLAPEEAAKPETLCASCAASIASDAVFCPVCGSLQEASPAAVAPTVGWKANLTSRRLLVPAVFVAMALAVALAPIPRRSAAVPPATASATPRQAPTPLAGQAVTEAATRPPAAPAVGKSGSPATNPTISSSVKQILGGVSSDFSKLLPVNEKAEPPSNGDPNLRVWVDTHKGYYYCPGEEQYGHTPGGSFMTQKEAESNYYIPALVKPCT